MLLASGRSSLLLTVTDFRCFLLLECLHCALLDHFRCVGELQISLDVHDSDIPRGVHRCPERNVFHSLEFLQVLFDRVPHAAARMCG